MTRPTEREGVETIYFVETESFLDALSPRAERWAPDPTAWVYRGQSNADWSLTPKAARGLDDYAKHGIVPTPELATESSGAIRVALEHTLLARFRRALDRAAIAVPLPSPRIVPAERGEPLNMAVLSESFPLMALAQHHGLPTGLLDWSRRAWVAAYFAAEGAARQKSLGATHLAVWALFRGEPTGRSFGPDFYDAPGSTNPNLHAQAGLFTVLHHTEDRGLEEFLAAVTAIGRPAPSLRRLTLEIEEAPKLLRLLSREGIDGASMFPGVDGVVRAMREITQWDVPLRATP